MSEEIWDAFSPPSSGDFPEAFKWDSVGVSIVGTITNIKRAEFDGKSMPELWIQTDNGERSVLCGQANLMAQLLDLRPNVGDKIAIIFTAVRAGKEGRTAKMYDVSLKRADGTEVGPSPEVANVKTAADLL